MHSKMTTSVQKSIKPNHKLLKNYTFQPSCSKALYIERLQLEKHNHNTCSDNNSSSK